MAGAAAAPEVVDVSGRGAEGDYSVFHSTETARVGTIDDQPIEIA